MTCPKCTCKVFRPFTDGQICANCGKLILEDVPIVMEHVPEKTENKGAAVGAVRLGQYRANNCFEYIKEVFPTIQEMLHNLKSWADISSALGWDRPVCTTIKTLKKYYRYELERRC